MATIVITRLDGGVQRLSYCLTHMIWAIEGIYGEKPWARDYEIERV